jgi:SPP1 family predicted phage head-tail adaptor
MRAGVRRHRLTIQQLVPSTGWGVDPSWQTYAQLWGTLEPLRGAELLTAQQLGSEITGRSETSYAPDITSAMRFVCGGRIYQIITVIDPEWRHRELQLLWKEQAPA